MAFVRPDHALRIGEFTLDPRLNELARDGAGVRVPARLVDLLLRLAQEPGRSVRREALLDEVWERRLVNDEVLSRAIADLRQLLGDDARAPRYIETLPKLGYRLLADVAVLDDAPRPPPGAAGEGAPAAAAAATSLPSSSTRAARIAPRLLAAVAVACALLAVSFAWRSAPRAPAAVGTRATPIDVLTPAHLLRARPFTTEPGRELYPRFTPDGRFVVYTRALAGADAPPAELRLRAVDGTEDRVLVGDALDNYCGAISPDGRTLAWLRARPGICELVQRPLLGGAASVLAGCDAEAASGCPDWRADGGALLLGGGRGGRRGLREIAFPAGTERVLTTPPDGASDLMPRAGRDGSLVFWRGDGWGRTPWRRTRDGREQALRAHDFLGFGHAFAADGTLLLADDSYGQRALVRLDVDGATQLLGASDARYPDVSADAALVYEIARYDANLWRVAADGGTPPQRLTQSARYDSQPVYSPDGAWLAFGSNRDGREGVYLMRSDGRDERKLALDPALRWTSPQWTPDGRRLLLLRYERDGASLCLFELERAAVECPPHLPRDHHAAFFLDDDTIGTIDAGGTPRLWRTPLAGGTPRADDGESVDRCRATARWLACHRPGRAGLRLLDRRDGALRELLPQLGADARGAWTLTADAVWFAQPAGDDGAAGVYRHDLRDGAQRRVGDLTPSAIGDALSVAPDESTYVVARTDGLETDLMYVPPP